MVAPKMKIKMGEFPFFLNDYYFKNQLVKFTTLLIFSDHMKYY